mmetsp:Transcript_25706/g.37919  ORF Transcript_25706/g.37919 Transcript_25706/m.37919 type:complete len:200 (+) Transcript_25706:119-718(+)
MPSDECSALRGYLNKGQWEEAGVYLRSESGVNEAKQNDPKENLLSVALKNSPPVEIVVALISSNPDAVSMKDVQDRLPLHVACACGASKDVIEVLIKQEPKAMLSKDKAGRIPLHHAVESACQQLLDCEDKVNGIKSTSPIVVKILLNSAQDSVMVADEKGETPLDIALRIEGATTGNRRATLVKSILHRISNSSRIVL